MKMPLVFFMLLLAGLFSPGPVWAAANIDHLFSLSLEELLATKVTGSTLTPKELKTVPAAVTVFTHKQIINLGLDSLDELMNMVPGFQSYRTSVSAMTYPYSARGRRIGNSSAEILIMVDGLRLAEPRTSGSAIASPKFSLMQVERVEFIRGPGSAVYGSNAMMGVVNIITRRDVDEGSISVGSFNRRQGHLLTTRQIGKVRMDLFAALEKDSGDEYELADTFSSGQIHTQDPRELAQLNLKFKWQDTRLNLHHNQFKVEDFYEQSGLSNGLNQREGGLTALSLQQAFQWQGITSDIFLGYTRAGYTSSLQSTAPGDLAAVSDPSSNDALFGRVNLKGSTESRFLWHNNWTINLTGSLQFGFEVRKMYVPEAFAKTNFDLKDLVTGQPVIRYYGSLKATTPVQKQSNRHIVGVYGQYQLRLFDNSHLTLGLRHDDFSAIGGQLSPRFAWVEELDENHSIKFLYGEAFRAPAEGELNLQNNPVVLGNPDLTPETVKSSELIWLGQWFDTGISVGYFESHYKDAIVQTILGGGQRQYENINQDPSKGVKFELSHQFNDSWLLRSTYTHIFETPDFSFRESDTLLSFMTNFQQANWNANLVASYQSSKNMSALNDQGERIGLKSNWVLMAKGQYYLAPRLRIFMQAKNLLDKHGLSPASSAKLTTGIPSRGREILTGASFEF